MTTRKAITAKMKVQCLLSRYPCLCSVCGHALSVGDKIEWDHIHALTAGGEHTYANLRPLHVGCHRIKTHADVALNAKVKRIRGETKNGPKRKIASRGFQKPTVKRKWLGRKFGIVERRT